MIALFNLFVLGFSFVLFHDKASKRTHQGNLLLPPAGRTAVSLLWSALDQVATLLRFQLLQSLALDVTHVAGGGDVQPGVVDSPIQ